LIKNVENSLPTLVFHGIGIPSIINFIQTTKNGKPMLKISKRMIIKSKR